MSVESLKKFSNKKVLITGGMGFIGSRLAGRLVELEANVTIIDNLNPLYGANLINIHRYKDKIECHIGDVLDEALMNTLVKEKEYIFHLAAQTSHMDSMTDPLNDLNINAKATLQLLEICRKSNPNVHFIMGSTRQIYGRAQYLPVNETHPLKPLDINGIHKMAAEQYVNLYSEYHGLQSSILRFTNVYGPGLRIKDARQMFLGLWIRSVLEGKPFEVWGGDQLRDLAYVDDVCEALLAVADCKGAIGQIMNVGTASPSISLSKLADLLILVAGSGTYTLKEYPSARKGIEIGDIYLCDRKLRTLTGWTPKVALEEGLKETLSYYREHLPSYIG